MKVGFTSSTMFISNEFRKKIFTIDRINLSHTNNTSSQEIVNDWIYFIYSLGIFSYQNVNLLLLVDEFNEINKSLSIYEIKKIKVIQITPGEQCLQIIKMIYDTFSFNNFYFSPSHPLHLPFSTTYNNDKSRNIFIWNYKSFIKMKEIFKEESDQFIISIINGSVTSIKNFCLISRRSKLMCGARFWLRGADQEGICANFIETESILFNINAKNKSLNKFKSFLQIRGSIPLHWTEYPNLAFLPPIKLDKSEVSIKRYQKHFNQLHSIYQEMKIYILNLTSKKGREKELTLLYENLCLNNINISYTHIDTEQICGVFHWNLLTDEIKKINFDKISFNELRDGNLIKKQNVIIRTNCADSIDRTNLVQCEISINALKISNKEFENDIRKCWVVNGNKLANQIVGSNALKSEITLYKHRTLCGLINDAFVSIIRYFYDNFFNGYRQDCLDFFTMSVDAFPFEIQKRSTIGIFWMFFSSLFLMFFNLIFFQFDNFKKYKNTLKESLINKPHFRVLDKIE